MKKSILLFALLMCCTTASFSQSAEEAALQNKIKTIEQKAIDAFVQKEIGKAEQLFLDALKVFKSGSSKLQEKLAQEVSGTYYNLACVQSLQNKKSEAVKSLELAYKYGYNDYRQTLTDTDLSNIRSNKNYKELLAKMKEETDYLSILQKAAPYVRSERQDTLPCFTYANPNDSNLVRVRQYFNLDSVAGAGDEISKIKKLLTFVHDKIRHDGQHNNPREMNAISMAEACKDGSRGLNCRGLAIVLNECYLAMGFKSRFVTCMPQKYINDCHVINAVYSNTLDKWIWVDPTNNAWVMDENGSLLSVQEVRERLRDNRPIVLNEEANWNNKSKQTKEGYLDGYMGKNLFSIICSDIYNFGTEDPNEAKKSQPQYIMLCPEGFVNDYPVYTKPNVIIYDDSYFWQSPYQK